MIEAAQLHGPFLTDQHFRRRPGGHPDDRPLHDLRSGHVFVGSAKQAPDAQKWQKMGRRGLGSSGPKQTSKSLLAVAVRPRPDRTP